jgi:hypothetical protein
MRQTEKAGATSTTTSMDAELDAALDAHPYQHQQH